MIELPNNCQTYISKIGRAIKIAGINNHDFYGEFEYIKDSNCLFCRFASKDFRYKIYDRSVLDGTTGNFGYVNISILNNGIYIENRSGLSVAIEV